MSGNAYTSEIHYQNVLIQVVHSDLNKEQVGAIITGTDNRLSSCGGLGGILWIKAGNSIKEECNEYIKKNGMIETGQIVVTGAGILDCK